VSGGERGLSDEGEAVARSKEKAQGRAVGVFIWPVDIDIVVAREVVAAWIAIPSSGYG
jgi:hypothetical protein